MKKVGGTTRPFRYDLNQISYDYTVEVANTFKGLDLIDRVPEELRMEVCDIVEKTMIKTIPKKKKCKKAKWLSEEALQIAVKKREAKSKVEKERYSHLNAEFQRIARRSRLHKRSLSSGTKSPRPEGRPSTAKTLKKKTYENENREFKSVLYQPCDLVHFLSIWKLVSSTVKIGV